MHSRNEFGKRVKTLLLLKLVKGAVPTGRNRALSKRMEAQCTNHRAKVYAIGCGVGISDVHVLSSPLHTPLPVRQPEVDERISCTHVVGRMLRAFEYRMSWSACCRLLSATWLDEKWRLIKKLPKIKISRQGFETNLVRKKISFTLSLRDVIIFVLRQIWTPSSMYQERNNMKRWIKCRVFRIVSLNGPIEVFLF